MLIVRGNVYVSGPPPAYVALVVFPRLGGVVLRSRSIEWEDAPAPGFAP